MRALRQALCKTAADGIQAAAIALVHIKTVLLYPVASLAVVGFMMVFLVNAPLGRFNTWIYQLLASMQGGSRVVMAAVLGL